MNLRLVTLGAVAFALAHATYAAWEQGWTYDEPFHLTWSRRLLESGNTERESHHRFNTKTPVMLPNVLAEKLARRLGVGDVRLLRLAARLPSVVWLAALLLTTFLLARRVAGLEAALAATAGSALDPSLVAHGSLATVDLSYALATLLALAAAAAFARDPAPIRGALVGLTLGLALATKFSALLLLPGILLLPLAAPDQRRLWARPRVLVSGVLMAIVAAFATLCGAYLFCDVALPLGNLPFKSGLLQRMAAAAPGLALPLPAAFLMGLDLSLAHEQGREGSVVILGHLHPNGVWFYFAFLWLVKTPVLALAAQVVGLLRAVLARIVASDPVARYLAANLALALLYFSFAFRTQLGYRYVLMCIPMAWVLAAAGLLPFTGGRRTLLAAGIAVALIENAAYLGNPLSFTSAAVWPKREVFRLIADSSVDWGQNRDKIQGWLADRGLEDTHLEPFHVLPGHNTLDLNSLAGVWNFEQHRWLRENSDPRGHFGHTYLWFEIDDATYGRFMDETRRFAPSRLGENLCSEKELVPLDPGDAGPFAVSESPARDTSWVACVDTKSRTDFGLRAVKGALYLGHYSEERDCETERLIGGQVAWYRLEPGLHAFCAAEVPNRRAGVPYVFRGEWLVVPRSAALALREAPVTRHGPASFIE